MPENHISSGSCEDTGVLFDQAEQANQQLLPALPGQRRSSLGHTDPAGLGVGVASMSRLARDGQGEKFVIRVGLSRSELENNRPERRGWGLPPSISINHPPQPANLNKHSVRGTTPSSLHRFATNPLLLGSPTRFGRQKRHPNCSAPGPCSAGSELRQLPPGRAYTSVRTLPAPAARSGEPAAAGGGGAGAGRRARPGLQAGPRPAGVLPAHPGAARTPPHLAFPGPIGSRRLPAPGPGRLGPEVPATIGMRAGRRRCLLNF